MILLTALGTGLLAALAHYLFYRHQARTKKRVLIKNNWLVTIEDLAEIIFLIPYLTKTDRIELKRNLTRFKVTSSYRRKEYDNLNIEQLPHSKNSVIKALDGWWWRLVALGLVGFVVGSSVGYIAIKLTLSL